MILVLWHHQRIKRHPPSLPSERDKMVADMRNHYLKNRINGRRIEMPIFNREDLEGWFYRAEIYLSMNEYSEEEKLKIVRLYFKGRALKWFKWYNNREPF